MDPIVDSDSTIEDDIQNIDVNISHILDKRLKDIEDCARVARLRQQYITSREEKPKSQPFSIFRWFWWA
jgi:hypothetical protein